VRRRPRSARGRAPGEPCRHVDGVGRACQLTQCRPTPGQPIYKLKNEDLVTATPEQTGDPRGPARRRQPTRRLAATGRDRHEREPSCHPLDLAWDPQGAMFSTSSFILVPSVALTATRCSTRWWSRIRLATVTQEAYHAVPNDRLAVRHHAP
jgi:hypothetical protein